MKILDPTFTTAYIARNFGDMVYDTRFAQDASGVPKPQMVDKWTTSKDGKLWTFTLRPNLKFSDGSESANACSIALVHTGERLLASIDRALRHHELSRAGRQALAVLDGAGQPLSPTAIAQRLIVTTASVTSLLDTLERRGLVERQPDPTDRRRLLVQITVEGAALVVSVAEEVRRLAQVVGVELRLAVRAHDAVVPPNALIVFG